MPTFDGPDGLVLSDAEDLGACSCGGKLAAKGAPEYALLHSQPTCAAYDRVETLADGADFLADVRRKRGAQ